MSMSRGPEYKTRLANGSNKCTRTWSRFMHETISWLRWISLKLKETIIVYLRDLHNGENSS